MKNKILKSGFSILAFLIFTLPLLAQEPDPKDPPIGDDLPIDNGFILLIFIAFSIGIYYIWKARQKQTA